MTVATLTAGAVVLTAPSAQALRGTSTASATATVTAGATSARAPAGQAVRAAPSSTPRAFTAAELALLNQRMADNHAMDKGRMLPAGAGLRLNAPLPEPGGIQPMSTTINRNSTIPNSAIKGGTSFLSSTQEPSTDANGGNIFQTGNWYATRSTNNGATWNYLDPFTLFGSGFCCDQVAQYDAATGRQFWVLQFSDHLVLANASASGSGAFTNWCYWNIDATWYGLPAGTTLDYNDMTIGDSNVYISSNYFGSSSTGAALLRLPKAPMSTCSGFTYYRINRSDNFTFKLVPGSTSTLYFGSNWGQTNGSSFRLFAWPESSGSYSYWDRTVTSYGFYTRNSGQNCASADGVVSNWCQFADSRVLGAYLSSGTIAFSFNAKQDGSHPFPYTRIVRFRESDKAYLSSSDMWGSWGALQFLSLAPNSTGLAGGVVAWGGGTGTTHYYPGSATYSTPANSLALGPNYFLGGAGNPCTSGGIPRWGDYLTVRTYKADTRQWIGAGYAMHGGSCGSTGAYPEPHNVQFS
ncbi:MAG TPA: hypothetical protein VFP72_09050 [Kineosporiaceae bacterium]|nr:hypothetical protein [Kineosporiaceae bacterium]